MPTATPIRRCCVAEGATTQRETYRFARTYLRNCATHLALWDAADAAAHRGGECPFAPAKCQRCSAAKEVA